jgi:hypothetical protein
MKLTRTDQSAACKVTTLPLLTSVTTSDLQTLDLTSVVQLGVGLGLEAGAAAAGTKSQRSAA